MIFDGKFPHDPSGKPLYEFLETYTSPVKRAEREIVGRETEKARVMAAMERPELCNVMLLAEAGSGKALKNDTWIPVADSRGYVQIKDIKPGDEVFDEQGNPTKVLGVYPQGKKRAFRVVFADGSDVICNSEHLWGVRKASGHYSGKGYEAVTLKDMMLDGIIGTQFNKGNNISKWYIPAQHAVQRKEADLPIHPYVIGVLLGDGSLRERCVLTVSSQDEDVVRKTAKLLGAKDVVRNEHNFGWHFLRRKTYMSSRGREVIYIQLNDLSGLSDDFDVLFGQKSVDKRIPASYMLGSVEQRRQLLMGLMDTDGTIGNNDRCNCSYSTRSAGLADDVKELATSLGYRASIRSYVRRKDGKTDYQVYISLPPEEKYKIFSCKRKVAVLDAHKNDIRHVKHHYEDMAIRQVEVLDDEPEMTCIYVAAPSHLFQCTKNHIVTHNTALVQGIMLDDDERYYLEVDLSHMIADLKDKNQMADKLKSLFDETQRYCKEENRQVVLFIDEFHQIVELSPAAVEALKPLLADSGTRGIRVIAATTFVEFRKWISPNQPLVERLQRINLEPPGKQMVVSILRGMARRYGVEQQFYNDMLFEEIFDLTNRYIPANAQPRKSILVLDAMVGWYRYARRRLDKKLLADVIYESEGVNIAFRVDASKIKEELDAHVFAQELASSIIQDRLQICVADLNDKSKPMSSFLFTGSTGTGKCLANDMPIPVPDKRGFVNMGDLQVGDKVFGIDGRPTKVLGVYPQGMKHSYKVTFNDGSSVICNDEHLWSVRNLRGHTTDGPYRVMTLQDILDTGFKRNDPSNKWYVKVGDAVRYPKVNFNVDPYVVGALLGGGLLSDSKAPVEFSSSDEYIIDKVGQLLKSPGRKQKGQQNIWSFLLPQPVTCADVHATRGRPPRKYYHAVDLMDKYTSDGIFGCRAHERHIPAAYMRGSVPQRVALLQGLMDTNGLLFVKGRHLMCLFSTTSEQLAHDVLSLMNSLGIRAKLRVNGAPTCVRPRYTITVIGNSTLKRSLFTTPSSRNFDSAEFDARRVITDDMKILDIEDLHREEPMTCILVDNPEHQFLATDRYCSVHNTEMTKQLARILFNDPRRLIRFDMTEFANESSLDLFRHELTNRVWERPYSIILLDEIEKACAPVTRVLLQVLDDGRLTDENNREVSFVNAYIVLTTNAGNEIYKDIAQYAASDTGSGESIRKYQKLIRNSITKTTGDNRFPPELLGRIDCIVPFQPLSQHTQALIVTSKLTKLRQLVQEKHGVNLKIKSRIVDYLVKDNLDTEADSGGARAVIAKLDSEVIAAVAKAINAHPEAKELLIDYEGTPAYENKHLLESTAHIVVTPVATTNNSSAVRGRF